MTRYFFDEHVVDATVGRLTVRGEAVPIQPLAWRLLLLFVRRPGTLVTRDELTAELWPGIHVTDDSLSQVIARLRRSLEDGDRLVATVPRRGYRFDAEVTIREAPRALFAWPDRFVGREPELAELHRRFADGDRLIVLVGLGGSGKTRLAHRFAEELVDTGVHVAFVDLGAARPDGVVSAIADALGICALGPTAAVAVGLALERRPGVVVLDNFEQLTSAAEATIGRWLGQTRETVFVVTSRAVLGVRGERIVRVDPLSPTDAADLFRIRAGADHSGVDAVVQASEGLPLAIEIVATRCRTVPPDQLLERMTGRLAELTGEGLPERHRSLQAVLDASWELLDGPDRRALERLAAFEGWFDLDAADAVITPDPVLDRIQALVDRSLLRVDLPQARYTMLVVVREYVVARAGAELAHARVRHGEHFARFVHQKFEADPGAWLVRTLPWFDDLVAAARAAVARADEAVAAPIAIAGFDLAHYRGPMPLALELLRSVEPVVRGPDRWRVLIKLGHALHSSGSPAEALRWHEEQRLIGKELGDRLVEGTALMELAALARSRGDLARAAEIGESAIPLLADDPARMTKLMEILCTVARRRGDLHEAQRRAEQAVGYATRGSARMLPLALANLGLTLAEAGDRDRGIAMVARAVATRPVDRSDSPIAGVVCELAIVLATAGEVELGIAWQQRAVDLMQTAGTPRQLAMVTGNLGVMLAEAGRPEEALAHLQRAQAIDSALGLVMPEWLAAIAHAHLALGRLGEALAWADQAVEAASAPRAGRDVRGEIHQVRAEVLLALGRIAEAEADVAVAEPILRVDWRLHALAELLCTKAAVLRAQGRPADPVLSEAREVVADGALSAASLVVRRIEALARESDSGRG